MAECARCKATDKRLFHMDGREGERLIGVVEEIIREHRHHPTYVPKFIVEALLVEPVDTSGATESDV